MFSKLTYKQKSIASVVGTGLVLICAYFLTFKKTIDLNGQVAKKEYTLSNLDAVKAEINGYEKLLENQNSEVVSDEIQLQNLLYEKVSEFCSISKEDLSIASFQSPHSFNVEKKSIQTCSFSVKGNYKGLLKLNELLEKELTFAQLAGAKYELIEKNKSKELIATYFIQNVYEI